MSNVSGEKTAVNIFFVIKIINHFLLYDIKEFINCKLILQNVISSDMP